MLPTVHILPQEIKDLNQTLEEMYQSQQVLQAQKGLVVSPAGSPEKQEKQHLIMELAESKAKSRKLRQQLYVSESNVFVFWVLIVKWLSQKLVECSPIPVEFYRADHINYTTRYHCVSQGSWNNKDDIDFYVAHTPEIQINALYNKNIFIKNN